MADLSRQHGDLPAVVGVVRDQVPEKSSCVGAEAFDAAIAGQGPVEYRAQSLAAVLERAPGLRGSHCGAIQLLRNLLSLRGFQPHHPHIVHVRHDRGNSAALAVERLPRPRFPRKGFDQITVDPVVGIKGVEQSER